MGDHRSSDPGLDLDRGARRRNRRPRRPPRVRRLGSSQSPSHAQSRVLLRSSFFRGRRSRAARDLRAAGGSLPAHPVPAVRSRSVASPGRSPHPAHGRRAGRQRGPLSAPRSRRRGEAHRGRRPGGDRRRPVADLGGLGAGHHLRRRSARASARRSGCRPAAPHGDQLRGGIGPPGRLGDRIGRQRRGPPSRRRPRRRRDRKSSFHPLPQRHHPVTRRPPRAGSRGTRHRRLARRSAGCRRRHRGSDGKATGAGCPHRLHEREPSGAGRSRARRRRGCAPRSCPTAMAGDPASA